MAIFFDSFAKAAAYFGGAISPQRLGQLADAQQLRTQEVASGHGGPPRRGVFHEDIAVHLERGDKLDAHDCPCWRVAYTQGVQLVDVGEHSRVLQLQKLLDLERAEWAKEREQLLAARRLVSSDVATLQQEIENLQLERTARRGIRGSPGYPGRSSSMPRYPAQPQNAGLIGMFHKNYVGFTIDVDGYPVFISVGEPEDVTGEAYDPGAEFLVNNALMVKIREGAVVFQGRVFKVCQEPQVVPLDHRLPFFPGPPEPAASEEPTQLDVLESCGPAPDRTC